MKDMLRQKLAARAVELGKDPATVEKSFDDYNTAWYHHKQLWREAPTGAMEAAHSAYELENIANDRAGGRFPAATGVETVGSAKIPAQRLWEMTERTASADKVFKKSLGDLVEHSLSDATSARNMLTVVSPDDLLGAAMDHIYESGNFKRWRSLMETGVADELTRHRPDIKWAIDNTFKILTNAEEQGGKAAVEKVLKHAILSTRRGPMKYVTALKEMTLNTEKGRRFVQALRYAYDKLPKKDERHQVLREAKNRGTQAAPAAYNFPPPPAPPPTIPKAASDQGE
jgi:hypothetical protein